MPQIAPTTHVELSMYELSDLGNWDLAKKSLKELVTEYEKWITEISEEAKRLDDSYQEAASNAVKKCRKTLGRIEQGVHYLLKAGEDSDVVKSFRWMNRAMLWQQQRSSTPQRMWIRTRNNGKIHDELPPLDSGKQNFISLEEFKESDRWGKWRPFQIAFILMNIKSTINPKSEEREIVDLIWFPTGGGKTEAYLGLSAFTIFYRRLKGEVEFDHEKYSGTTILMRYTLRLLTTQQYERAASLICACELIRRELEESGIYELGDAQISIGLWVGGSSTPNDNGKARSQFAELKNNRRFNHAPYNFVVMKCPCCSAQIGKISNVKYSDGKKVKGLFQEDGRNGRVLFQCENEACEFYDKNLPLYVVDEHIYDKEVE
jgi:exonuclease VII small subunit